MAPVKGPTFTKAQLMAFVAQSPENAISYVVGRNPSTAYKFIQSNYNTFGSIAPQVIQQDVSMRKMFDFLSTMYARVPNNKKAHWLSNLLHSLPAKPELINEYTATNE